MGAIKKYFKSQFQTQKFKYEYENGSDFYLGCFQKSDSCVPLLLIRALLFLASVAIVITSIIMVSQTGRGSYWPAYLTQWGIFLMMVASGFGFAISLKAYVKGPIDTTFGLPWYLKTYWVLYNVATPLAVFITIFYWAFLSQYANSEEVGEYAPNKVLDILVHAINSVVMVLLLLTARQPVYILHFYNVLAVALIYVFFSIVYWAAGGTDILGNEFIYPMLNWNNPGVAVIAVVFCAILINLVHFFITLLAEARDALGRWYRRDNSFEISAH